jgi:hypothetical protein
VQVLHDGRTDKFSCIGHNNFWRKYTTENIMEKTTSLMPEDTFHTLSQDAVDFYQANGFVRIREIITREEVAKFRQAALDFMADNQTYRSDEIFVQMVNVWRDDAVMKQLTFHPNIITAASKLAGAPLRLWHDQILTKQPGQSKATEFYQDQPYWPHTNSPHPISCWIALCDVPVERGCMTFLPGSQKRTDLPAQSLNDAKSLFFHLSGIAMERARHRAAAGRRLHFSPRPLRAHGHTEFNGRTACRACGDFYGCSNAIFRKTACCDGAVTFEGRRFVGWGVVSSDWIKVRNV